MRAYWLLVKAATPAAAALWLTGVASELNVRADRLLRPLGAHLTDHQRTRGALVTTACRDLENDVESMTLNNTTTEPRRTLAEALRDEVKRVRERLRRYEGLGDSGAPAALMMQMSLELATKAIDAGDQVAMVYALRDLSEYPA